MLSDERLSLVDLEPTEARRRENLGIAVSTISLINTVNLRFLRLLGGPD
jgi:hypothetical protein